MSALPHHRIAQSPLVVLAAAISTGILLGSRITSHPRSVLIISALVVAGLVVLSIWLVRKQKLTGAPMLLVVAFVFTGLTLWLIENRSVAPNRIFRMYEQGTLAVNEPVELTGVVRGQPESAPDGFYLTVKAERIRSKGMEREASGDLLLLAHTRDAEIQNEYDRLELRHGARIRVMTTLDRDEDYRNPGVMPFTEYLERKGYDATGVIKSPMLIERLDDEAVFLPLGWLYEWRGHLEKEFARLFSAETAGVLDAALLGNHYQISRGAAERFRAGGTFHVLVISGLQIAFIGGLAIVIVRWFTKRRFLQFLLAATFLWAYTVAVGADASVVRSAFMFTIVALAPAVSRRASTLNNLGGAAIALLVWRPNDLFDPSFQLTFLSVVSIVTIAVPIMTRMQQVGSWRPTHETPYPPTCSPWFRKLSEALFWSQRTWKAEMDASNIRYRLFKTQWASRFERWHVQRLLRFAMAAIVVSAGVQIGMLPLLIIYFHRISFASLLLNIFVGVLMAMVAFAALAAIVIAQFSSWAAAPLVWLAEKFEWLMVHSVDPFSRSGTASIRLPHYHGWAAVTYVLYFLVLGLLVIALSRWNPLRPGFILPNRRELFRRVHLNVALVAFVLLLSLIVFHPATAARADGKLHVDFLDVGQGDCALITMPDGTALLIDGGGRPNIGWDKDDADAEASFARDTRSIGEGVVSEYLWSRGLDRVDYILPTHADADHIDGLNDVARNFKVRGAIVARTPVDDAEYARFAQTMNGAGVPMVKVGAGDVLRFGNVTADVLWPPASAEVNAPYRNDDGVVLRISYGDKVFLFTADIEKHAETALLGQGSDLRSDVVKVAHHGSKTSSIESFVAVTRPELAIISVGRTSIFGHPNKEVVERWRASGAKVMTTGQEGTMSIVTNGCELTIQSFVRQ